VIHIRYSSNTCPSRLFQDALERALSDSKGFHPPPGAGPLKEKTRCDLVYTQMHRCMYASMYTKTCTHKKYIQNIHTYLGNVVLIVAWDGICCKYIATHTKYVGKHTATDTDTYLWVQVHKHAHT
jgi:hypothetical protein